MGRREKRANHVIPDQRRPAPQSERRGSPGSNGEISHDTLFKDKVLFSINDCYSHFATSSAFVSFFPAVRVFPQGAPSDFLTATFLRTLGNYVPIGAGKMMVLPRTGFGRGAGSVVLVLFWVLGSVLAKDTAFVEVVLFESSPNGDYTTYTTGLQGSFSRAGATISAEGEIVQVRTFPYQVH